jgi:hypothetical protein
VVVSTTHASATQESLEVKNGEQQQRHLEHVEVYDQTTVDAEGKQSQEGRQTRVEQHEVHPSLLQHQQEQQDQQQPVEAPQPNAEISDAPVAVEALEAAPSDEPATANDVEISEF